MATTTNTAKPSFTLRAAQPADLPDVRALMLRTFEEDFGYGYNPDGDVTSLTYPNGQTVTRGYDAANRLTSVTDWLGHTTMMSADADGDTAAVTYGNGVVAAATFDNADQVSAITDTGSAGTPLVSFGYIRSAPFCAHWSAMRLSICDSIICAALFGPWM